MRRIAVPCTLFVLSWCFLSLTCEVAQAGHGVRIGAADSAESALLAAIAGELVRTALDVPILLPPLANSGTAWKALRAGDLDAYPESIATLAAEILHNPAAVSMDCLRSLLAKQRIRMTDPVGGFVLLYRAELPDICPASALLFVRMPRLVGPAEWQDMVARSREVPPSAIAAEFLSKKLPLQAGRRSPAGPWLWGTALLGILAACWARSRVERPTINHRGRREHRENTEKKGKKC